MKVLHIGLDAAKTPPSSLTKTFHKYFDTVHELHTGNANLNAQIQSLCENYKPDVVFMQIQEAGKVNNESLKCLRHTGAFVVNWSGDVRAPLPNWYIETGKRIDLTLMTNLNDVDTLRNNGVNADFLQIGYDPGIYKPNYSVNKTIDIVFSANNHGNSFPLSGARRDLAHQLKSCYGDRFHVYGVNWPFASGNLNHSQKAEAAMYQQAKIAINMSHFNYKRYTSDRMLRILGCGVMCLSHRFPEIEKDYEDGKDLVCFDNVNDLIKKINFYLDNPEQRNIIAQSGYQKAINELTFDKMIEGLVSFYKQNRVT